MSYQLPPDVQQRIQTRLESGADKRSQDEILRHALDALDWQDEECIAIQEGIHDMEAGRVRPLREFDKEFRDRKNITRDA